MLLAIDVGNTEMKLGLFMENELEPRHFWRLMTNVHRTGDELYVFIAQLFSLASVDPQEIADVVIASVVPRVDHALVECVARFDWRAPRFLRGHEQHIMPILADRPAEVGADLIAVAIGACEHYGSPLIVISYGTATVFIAVNAEGAFAGAAIAPGIITSIDALVGRTAKLPQVPLQAPQRAIGKDTMSALQSGIVFSVVGQTQALVKKFRDELGVSARVIATGGLAHIVAGECDVIDAVMPHAGLQGLRIFACRHES